MSAAAYDIHLLFWSSFLPFFVLPRRTRQWGVFGWWENWFFTWSVKAVNFPIAGTFRKRSQFYTFNHSKEPPSGTITFTRGHRTECHFRSRGKESWESSFAALRSTQRNHPRPYRTVWFSRLPNEAVAARKLVCWRDEKLLFTTPSVPTYTFSKIMRICLFNRCRFHHKTNVNLFARVCPTLQWFGGKRERWREKMWKSVLYFPLFLIHCIRGYAHCEWGFVC